MSDYVSVDINEITKTQEKFGRRIRTPIVKVSPW